MPTMTEDPLLPFDLPSVTRRKVTTDFADGSISPKGGLALLRAAETQAAGVLHLPRLELSR